MFLLGNYNNKSTHTLERIIEDWLEKEPIISIAWFSKVVKRAAEYVENNPDKGREVWFDTKKSIAYISKERPKILVEIMHDLVSLWKNYAYVGNPKELLESYKNISDPVLKEKTKEQFKMWYKEMSDLNQNIYTVDWNL